jgi:hypothetical protein
VASSLYWLVLLRAEVLLKPERRASRRVLAPRWGAVQVPRRKRRSVKTVLYVLEYFIDKDKIAEYTKTAKEELIPHWLATPGLKEFRAYREQGSTKVLVEMEFDTFESWGKTVDNPKTKEITKKFTSLTHGLEWTIWDKSPITPKPLKPSRKK